MLTNDNVLASLLFFLQDVHVGKVIKIFDLFHPADATPSLIFIFFGLIAPPLLDDLGIREIFLGRMLPEIFDQWRVHPMNLKLN